MASSSSNNSFMKRLNHFPPVIDGRINVIEFLAAASDVVAVVERLGTVFTPVRSDIQGNIDKIKKFYKYDNNSCLLELMLEEKSKGNPIAAEGILWLNRALLFMELVFAEIIIEMKSNTPPNDVSMKRIFTVSYEGSVKKYHNWVTQQLFSFVCKMSPSLPQIFKSLEVDDIKEVISILEKFNVTLHLVRCKIDDFFKDNQILKNTSL